MSNIAKVLNSFQKAKVKIVWNLEDNLWDAGLFLEGAVKDRTPVKEDTLASSINTSEVKTVWTKKVVEVWTNIEYAVHVEYWVTAKTKTWKVRKTPYDYHKWDNIFLSATGAWMFRRSVDEEQDTIKDIIKNWW